MKCRCTVCKKTFKNETAFEAHANQCVPVGGTKPLGQMSHGGINGVVERRQEMNWDDPAARLALIEQVGPAKYNELIKAHHKASVVATVNGHDIRPVNTRFGRLFMVGNTGQAFGTQAQAETFAAGK